LRACLFLIAAASVAGGCQSDLPAASLVGGVRILATRADLPYAKPGETVSIQALAVDGRPNKPTPMHLYWLPTPCVNPAEDDYFACYPSFAGTFTPGIDLKGSLVEGAEVAITMPADAITAAPLHPGATEPYGVAFVFLAACAGTLEYRPPGASESPLATPFACYDQAGAEVGPSGFVFAFSRIYVYADRRNENPTITNLTFGGAAVDPSAGITVAHCRGSNESDCSATDVDVVVPDSSWEIDPGSQSPSGRPLHEGVWVDYYVSGGQLGNDAVVLFDANTGRASSTKDAYSAPLAPGEETLWAVVHDSRGGASWVSIPLAAK
jgi:hypothetical protein